VPGRSAARGRPDGLAGAGEIEQVRALGVVELQRPGQCFEDAVGGAGELAALEAGVVRGADAGQDRDFLAAQAGDAAGAVFGQGVGDPARVPFTGSLITAGPVLP
jgi:hypothetical protein